jgi:predicted Na+-dependent transporter
MELDFHDRGTSYMLETFNRFLQKIMPLITPSAVLIGIVLSRPLSPLDFLVPWIFAFTTFAGSLTTGFRDLLHTLSKPFPITVNLVVLHVVMPLIALGVAEAVFHNDSYLVTGIVLGLVIPGGITSYIWSAMYRGNLTLTLSVLLLSTLLSPYIVPHSIEFLLGSKISIDTWAMSKGLFWMIVAPSLLGMLLNRLSKGKVAVTLAPKLAPFSKLSIGVVVAINSAVVAPFLKPVTWRLVGIAAIVFALAAIGYVLGIVLAWLFRWDRGTLVASTFSSGMRNISAGAVIALAYFPPPVSIPVILGMLFQQMLASFYGMLLERMKVGRDAVPERAA